MKVQGNLIPLSMKKPSSWRTCLNIKNSLILLLCLSALRTWMWIEPLSSADEGYSLLHVGLLHPSCQTSITSNSCLLASISQHRNNHLRISLPSRWLQSFWVAHSLLRDKDWVVSVSFMISVSSSSCSCDCSAAGQAASSDSYSCSLLAQASSSFTKRINFCLHCLFLVLRVTDIVSGLVIASVVIFALSSPRGAA